jgi:hypothetical protein
VRKFLLATLLWLIACVALTLGPWPGRAAERRFASVVGNSQYKTGTLAMATNDVGLVAASKFGHREAGSAATPGAGYG